MKKIILSLMGLSSICWGSLTYAGGPDVPQTWTGFYIGGNIGDAWASSKWVYQNRNPYDSLGPTLPVLGTVNQFNMNSQIASGFQLGLNYQYHHLLIGPEATFDWANLSKTIPNVVPVFSPNVERVNTSMTNMFYTLTGRLGALAMSNWLVYAKGGYANTRIDTSGYVTPFFTNGEFDWGNDGKQHNGWVVGAGTEYRFIKYMSVGIEYDYMSFNAVNHTGGISPRIVVSQIVHRVDGSIQNVVARLNLLVPF